MKISTIISLAAATALAYGWPIPAKMTMVKSLSIYRWSPTLGLFSSSPFPPLPPPSQAARRQVADETIGMPTFIEDNAQDNDYLLAIFGSDEDGQLVTLRRRDLAVDQVGPKQQQGSTAAIEEEEGGGEGAEGGAEEDQTNFGQPTYISGNVRDDTYSVAIQVPKLGGGGAGENKGGEHKGGEHKHHEHKGDENKVGENKSGENKSSKSKSRENKSGGNKSSENKSSENKSSENVTSKEMPSEDKVNQNKIVSPLPPPPSKLETREDPEASEGMRGEETGSFGRLPIHLHDNSRGCARRHPHLVAM